MNNKIQEKMNLKDILNGLEKRDSYDLFIWITFLSKKIDCVDCIDVCVSNNKIPDCSKCVPTKKLINKAKRLLEEKEIKKCQDKSKRTDG